jgi:hypothetical protein
MVAAIKCGQDNQGVLPEKGALYQCSCSPLERSVALVTGKDFLKYFFFFDTFFNSYRRDNFFFFNFFFFVCFFR